MTSKPLIFFFILCVSAPFQGAHAGIPDHKKDSRTALPKKKTSRTRSGPLSLADIPVRFVWQVISSQGQGSTMNTSAETFAAEGRLIPIGVNQWKASVDGIDVAVNVSVPQKNSEGSIFMEKIDLIKLLQIELPGRGAPLENGKGSTAALNDPIQLILSKSANRPYENIYRAPDEELFLLKASVILLNARNNF